MVGGVMVGDDGRRGDGRVGRVMVGGVMVGIWWEEGWR